MGQTLCMLYPLHYADLERRRKIIRAKQEGCLVKMNEVDFCKEPVEDGQMYCNEHLLKNVH
jgi:hypothetical protein